MLTKSTSLFLLAGVLLAGCGKNDDSTPNSDMVNLSATLSGSQEVPANASAASGTMTGMYDKNTHALKYTVTYTGITPAAGHIHTGKATENGPVAVPFSGISSPITGTATVSEDDAKQILAGNSYVNFHTQAYGNGEIRGNIKVQ